MKHFNVFLATLVLTLFAFVPVAAFADRGSPPDHPLTSVSMAAS